MNHKLALLARISGNVHKHFQKNRLKYSETQMFQDSPEACEKFGLVAKSNFALDARFLRGASIEKL